MLDMQKKGVSLQPTIINDLRSAKLMIEISESPDAKGDLTMKVDEHIGNVESLLLAEAEKTLGANYVDEWLKRIDEASVQCETCTPHPTKKEENKFITGVPRDQKWVRVEPHDNLTCARIKELAQANSLQVNEQKDGKLVVYGSPDSLKAFVKEMTAETSKK